MAKYRSRVRVLSTEDVEITTRHGEHAEGDFDGSAQAYAEFLADMAVRQGRDDPGPMRPAHVVVDVWEADGSESAAAGHAEWPP
ncbi:hypothetical protein GCM10010193_39990 [Kitasatospora atroaurantiaca]|uniref:Uncharacterized protein n=1 Tax=Kitasatospora atroaurantiaca TaxID=285545 RepID=A0A561EKT6_9ACTN|nr:hypothetical protein FB465_1207 [Kitasatospora atroaurantiaca]